MVHIQEIVNSLFTSKTYIIYREGDEKAWLVDIGDIEPVVSFLNEKNLKPEGVFLTHGHFDHIYGINNLIEKHPNCKVYATPYCIECLASPKLNMSKYHECPITYEGDNVVEMHEGEEICLFDNEPAMRVYETPGHNPGCMTMVFGDMIFTGDAFIPKIKVVTNVPGGDRIKAQESLERILRLSTDRTIYPGHGEVFQFGEVREYYEKYIMEKMLIKNTPPQLQSNRLLGLDFFRIFLAILIYAFHSYVHLRCHYGVLDKFVWEGAVAMTGFFMLSGFSLQISSSKMDFTDVGSLKTFYTKRLISIIPLYFFVHILKMFWENSEPLVNRVLMFPIQTLGIQAQFSTLFNHTHNGGTWFISCLLASYFVFPLVHLILDKLNVKQSLILLLILVFVLLWSPFVQIFVGTNNIYDNPFFRFLEFSIGMILYNLWVRLRNNSWLVRIFNWPMAIAVTGLLIVSISIAYSIGIPGYYMLYSWAALPCFIVMILSLANLQIPRLQDSRVIRYASSISYAFFLAQCVGLWTFSKDIIGVTGIDDNLFKIAISFVLCTVISVLMHELIERPASKILKLKYLKK